MFISSDTNIWIDFLEIKHVEHPFRLDHSYYLSSAAFENEVTKSVELRKDLLQLGLCLTDLSDEEFIMARTFRTSYRKLSLYDRLALAIAKARSWTLLTGDNSLRKAAEQEGVECHGVIWIYDELRKQEKISDYEYHEAIESLLIAVQEGKCRLPVEELRNRL